MIILHCLKTSEWRKTEGTHFYGAKQIQEEGFIHCSEITTFQYVAPNFREVPKPLSLLCIDTALVTPPIRWETDPESGRKYPHIYGELNLDAVVKVLPYQKEKNGDWIMNKELLKLKDQ